MARRMLALSITRLQSKGDTGPAYCVRAKRDAGELTIDDAAEYAKTLLPAIAGNYSVTVSIGLETKTNHWEVRP